MPSDTFENRLAERIPSGYEGQNVPDDFNIPDCTLEDIDKALFSLFNETLHFNVNVNKESKKVPVLFATGERFAMIQHKLPLRNRDGSNILPMIAIKRASIDQSIPNIGRGLGQNTGDLIIKRRLSTSDRRYQSIINKNRIKNQLNAVSSDNPVPGTVSSRRDSVSSQSITQEPLRSQLNDNIFEIITIPWPQFVAVNYEIMFWTSYTQHMNEMLEHFLSSYHGQGNNFKLTTDKGYWFVGYVKDTFDPQDNFSDFTDQERIIKYTFNIEVHGFLVASKAPGQESPFRSFVSAPQITFGIQEISKPIVTPFNGPLTGKIDKFTLSDVEILDKRGEIVGDRSEPAEKIVDIVQDPFTGQEDARYIRIVGRNQRKGETVYRLTDLETIEQD